MASSQLMADYRQWLTFQRQEQLSREHQGISQRLEDARASANQVLQPTAAWLKKHRTKVLAIERYFYGNEIMLLFPAKAGSLCAAC